jgi:sugar lactone lactonase YvrE
VLRYDGTSGAFIDVFVDDSTLVQPFSLVFGPSGDLYVSSGSGNRVLRYDGRTGDYVGVAAKGAGLTQPIGLRFGPDGHLYVANSVDHNVLRFDATTGEPLGIFASDSLRFPSDLVFGPGGDLYVSSAMTRAVVRFDGETGALIEVAARLPGHSAPVGLDVDTAGRIVVGDFAGGRLFRLTGAGEPALLSEEGLAGPESIAVRR